jgi:hypothetical protein
MYKARSNVANPSIKVNDAVSARSIDSFVMSILTG